MALAKLGTARNTQRVCRCSPTVLASSRSNASTQVLPPPPILTDLPPKRKTAPPPEPVPVIHSRAFLVYNSKLPPATQSRDEHDTQVQKAPKQLQDINSIQDILSSLDEQLNQIEANPSPIQKAIYDVSRGPVGEATSNSVSAAARLTVAATKEAARVAAPVGKWVLQEGMKAAMRLASQAMELRESEKTGTMKISKRAGGRK